PTPLADAPPPQAEATPPADASHAQAPAAPRARRAKPRSRRGGRPQVPRDLPRSRAALPLDELRDASRSTLDLFGRQAVREAFGILAQRERRDLSDLIARDEDHRPRARNIANGSLGAGRIDKAMSATIVAMARHEDLWSVALDKELAAEKLGRVRAAKQRDQRRAERARDRDQRADRVSRADLQKAQDGRVGATIRIVTEDDRRGRRGRNRGEQESTARNSVLDRLGY
ncbi:MAG: hypothetical protein LT070_00005, partial [Solirubrobacteraceae bacterium]|nr:hypothetical protein [Solirubrobacteraceae bacterium]